LEAYAIRYSLIGGGAHPSLDIPVRHLTGGGVPQCVDPAGYPVGEVDDRDYEPAMSMVGEQ